MGAGGFHRSHQAVYFDRLLARGHADWADRQSSPTRCRPHIHHWGDDVRTRPAGVAHGRRGAGGLPGGCSRGGS
ncbi:MAG: hypothetical protein M3P89_01645 [Actinomycetota bacterium]|nr:hypothetical protein [Actinomycetota bacterium]